MDEDIAHLAHLARIQLTEEEKNTFRKNLDQILSYVEQISDVDTQGVLPCGTVLEKMHNVMGEDEIKEPMARDVFLKNAPDQVGGMIRVPPVIENENDTH